MLIGIQRAFSARHLHRGAGVELVGRIEAAVSIVNAGHTRLGGMRGPGSRCGGDILRVLNLRLNNGGTNIPQLFG